MKNIFAITVFIAAFAFAKPGHAQSNSRTAPAAASPSAPQDTTKKGGAAPTNSRQAPSGTQSNSKNQSSSGSGSGTKMAINEQGVPTKTSKKQAAVAPAATPDDKKKSEK